MITVNKKWARVILLITYFLLAFSVLTKLFYVPYIAEKFTTLGIAPYAQLFGVIELVAVLLYLYPKTTGLGFALLCSYLGGAIATDIQAPQYLYQPLLVLLFLFVATYLRMPTIFSEHFKLVQKTCCTIVSWKK